MTDLSALRVLAEKALRFAPKGWFATTRRGSWDWLVTRDDAPLPFLRLKPKEEFQGHYGWQDLACHRREG